MTTILKHFDRPLWFYFNVAIERPIYNCILVLHIEVQIWISSASFMLFQDLLFYHKW